MECGGWGTFLAAVIFPDKVFLEKYLSVSLFKDLGLDFNLGAVD